MDRGLLMANQNVLEFVLLEDGVVDIQDGAAGLAEDVLDALFREAAHQDFGASELLLRRCFVIHETFLSRSIGD